MVAGRSLRTSIARSIIPVLLAPGLCLIPHSARSQTSASSTAVTANAEDSGTSTHLFIMLGSDFDRPGLLPRANDNIGIGHSFNFLKKDPIGDELTFSYTYENAGSHGFVYTGKGEHTETAGVMKNVSLPKTKLLTGYTWVQSGTGKQQAINLQKNL